MNPISSQLSQIKDWLVKPSQQITEPGARKQAELTSSLMLFFSLIILLALFVSSRYSDQNRQGLSVLGLLSVALFVGYLFSRTLHYRISGYLLVGIWTISTLIYVYSGQTTNGPIYALLTFMPFSFLLSSTLLGSRSLAVFTLINLTGLLILPAVETDYNFRPFMSAIGVLVCLGGLTYIAQNHRNNIEQERLSALSKANEQLISAHRELEQANVQLENRVAERTAQLESTVRDLEAFSYSVSHDLRTPLRAINGYSQMLADTYSKSLPEECQRYLVRVLENGRVMDTLINELLAFAHLGRREIVKHPVEVRPIVEEALNSLQDEQVGRQITIQFGTLPTALADSTLLRQAYTNLLSNALKYTRHKDQVQIEIGSLEKAGKLVYFVRDNGAGFDMAYAPKLFGVFQRLHHQDEFEGIGIGLANVKRIIERHGGSIWAEGMVDQGATFYFTL